MRFCLKFCKGLDEGSSAAKRGKQKKKNTGYNDLWGSLLLQKSVNDHDNYLQVLFTYGSYVPGTRLGFFSPLFYLILTTTLQGIYVSYHFPFPWLTVG